MLAPMAEPDDSWGVLGPTNCPMCRRLRKDPVFAVVLMVGIGFVVYCMARVD